MTNQHVPGVGACPAPGTERNPTNHHRDQACTMQHESNSSQDYES